MHQRGALYGRAIGEEGGGDSIKARSFIGKHHLTTKDFFLIALALFTCSLLSVLLFRATFNVHCNNNSNNNNEMQPDPSLQNAQDLAAPNGLEFMEGKLVILVSHELSLTGGPLLLMELAVLLCNAGAKVQWITNQKETESNPVSQNLEAKLLQKGVQILAARGPETVKLVHDVDLVILNTAVAGKWLDSILKEGAGDILPKILWWIHEMRGHYFKIELVKHLPNVGGAMIDSHATAKYWQDRTKEKLRIAMPPTYVVHLGNSKELTEAAENEIARRLLREHVRETLGLGYLDVAFAIINSVSRGKGQDLFLKSFYEALQIMQQDSKLQVEGLHAIVVGSDMSAEKYETELRDFVKEKEIQHHVHFVNKTMNVIPFLAATDVLVQNSQARGECFGRITIEAMAFCLPVLGTGAGGTMEIVVNGSTGILHPVGKEGILPLARNIVDLYTNKQQRVKMGENGYKRVKMQFMERHMTHRIGHVLKEVLNRAANHKQY